MGIHLLRSAASSPRSPHASPNFYLFIFKGLRLPDIKQEGWGGGRREVPRQRGRCKEDLWRVAVATGKC